LGWNNLQGFPLDIRHNGNQPIDWYTNAIQRMRLQANATYSIGSFTLQAKNGALGLSPNNTLWVNGPGPFSRLHLHDGTTSVLQSPYRPWMDNGITFTTNSDQMYIGHKVETGSDQTAAVIQWGDNDAPDAGPDVLKFLFMGGYTGGNYGVGGLNGRELGRFHPQGFLGLGDWQAAAQQPDERLDLLSRTIRLRDFVHPTLYRNDTYDRILVVNPADGRVHWRPVSSLVTADCDWVVQGTNDVSTAYAGSVCPPGWLDGVGIGVQYPKAKLHVAFDGSNIDFSGEVTYSVHSSATLGGRGITGEARTPLSSQFVNSTLTGIRGLASNGRYSYAVDGQAGISASSAGPAVDIIGVRGTATGNNNAGRAIGLYGTATGAGSQTWAVYSEGAQFSTTAGTWTTSDASLKMNVLPIEGALERIMQLRPSSYTYRTEEFQYMHLAEGQQYGLVAQELEEVFPEMVRQVQRPADLDSTGNEIVPASEFKAVNYEQLIPILVAGIQEQNDRIQRLEEQLAACCSNPAGDRQLQEVTVPSDVLPDEGATVRKLNVVPNPFNESTTVFYTLDRSGRTQLLANSSDGRDLRVLHEANLEAGEYQFHWNTAALAPGMYYITLLVDGQPVVKKAVKVDR
jgi:hypothetical protein